jgi:hypothetical protein
MFFFLHLETSSVLIFTLGSDGVEFNTSLMNFGTNGERDFFSHYRHAKNGSAQERM